MRFDIVTIFPGYFASPLAEALIGRAVDAGLLDFRIVDLRDFSDDPHRKVDDEAYGGGPGMVMAAPPVFAAVEALRAEKEAPAPHVVFLSPQGRRFDAAFARELAGRPRVALVCGRYEGIDERTREAGLFDEELSLGDFVLPGGEVAALAVVEAVSRFVPGVVGDPGSVRSDSFEDGLLDHPHYTRPREFRGLAVPEVLFRAITSESGSGGGSGSSRRPSGGVPICFLRASLTEEERKRLERLARRRESP